MIRGGRGNELSWCWLYVVAKKSRGHDSGGIVVLSAERRGDEGACSAVVVREEDANEHGQFAEDFYSHGEGEGEAQAKCRRRGAGRMIACPADRSRYGDGRRIDSIRMILRQGE